MNRDIVRQRELLGIENERNYQKKKNFASNITYYPAFKKAKNIFQALKILLVPIKKGMRN